MEGWRGEREREEAKKLILILNFLVKFQECHPERSEGSMFFCRRKRNPDSSQRPAWQVF
jgi:hypothetical protein